MHPSVDSERNGCWPLFFQTRRISIFFQEQKKSLQFSGWLASNLRALQQLKPNDVFMLIEKEEKDFWRETVADQEIRFHFFEEKRTSQWRIEKSGLFQNISSSLLLKKELDYYYSLSLLTVKEMPQMAAAHNGDELYGKHILVWQFKSLYTLQNLSVLPRKKKKRSKERDDALKGFGSLAPHRHCVVYYTFLILSSLLLVHLTRFCTSLVPFITPPPFFPPLRDATVISFLCHRQKKKLVHFFFQVVVSRCFTTLSMPFFLLCLVGLLLRVWLLHSRNVKWSWLA